MQALRIKEHAMRFAKTRTGRVNACLAVTQTAFHATESKLRDRAIKIMSKLGWTVEPAPTLIDRKSMEPGKDYLQGMRQNRGLVRTFPDTVSMQSLKRWMDAGWWPVEGPAISN